MRPEPCQDLGNLPAKLGMMEGMEKIVTLYKALQNRKSLALIDLEQGRHHPSFHLKPVIKEDILLQQGCKTGDDPGFAGEARHGDGGGDGGHILGFELFEKETLGLDIAEAETDLRRLTPNFGVGMPEEGADSPGLGRSSNLPQQRQEIPQVVPAGISEPRHGAFRDRWTESLESLDIKGAD